MNRFLDRHLMWSTSLGVPLFGFVLPAMATSITKKSSWSTAR
jgi:hypothetical protein